MRRASRFLLAGILCAVLALGCVVLFAWIGASVDAHGVLHEPFFLIPLAWLLGVAALYFGFRYWRKRRL